METFEPKVMRKLIRQSPEATRVYETIEAELKADRLASPPGPGNLRNLKRKAEADALERAHQVLGSEDQYTRQAQLYDRLFARDHGTAVRR